MKHLEIVLERAINREKELEEVCKEQADRIEQLNQLVIRTQAPMNYVYGLHLTLLKSCTFPGGEIQRRKTKRLADQT